MTRIPRSVTGAAAKSSLVNTLTATIPTTGGQIQIVSATGWPTANFVVILDRGKATVEKILCSSRSQTILTVDTRGYDGTTAQAHSPGAVVEHIIDAVALTALLEHVNTDAGHDHSSYLLATAVGVAGDLAAEPVATVAALGTTGKFTDAAHAHPWPAIPAFRLSQQSAVQSFTSAVAAGVQFDTEALDTHNGHSNSTNNTRYTIPSGWDGDWSFVASVEFAANATGYRQLQFLRNGVGTPYGPARETTVTTGGVTSIVTTTIEFPGLAGGDYIEVQAVQTSGGALTIPGSTQFTRFEGWWVRP